MISFVWSARFPFVAGSGGSESYTAGQIRELQRRGIECRILTIGHGENDGRTDFPDINFQALENKQEIAQLDDTIVFVTYPLDVKTKRKSYVILHCPPPAFGQADPLFDPKGFAGKKLIATSRFAAKMWSRYLASTGSISVVYPFAEPVFSEANRPITTDSGQTRILFAGRLTPDKGVYTILAALHLPAMKELDYSLTFTDAGSHSEDGRIIKQLIEAHPNINLVAAKRTPSEMAKLMTAHDVIIMPTTDIFWKESFGILSVEAQHAGCRVVASKAGGLPETDCGGLIAIKPDDPLSLARGIYKAALLGPLTAAERSYASSEFTIAKSVDALLKQIKYPVRRAEGQPQTAKAPIPLLPGLSLNRANSKQQLL